MFSFHFKSHYSSVGKQFLAKLVGSLETANLLGTDNIGNQIFVLVTSFCSTNSAPSPSMDIHEACTGY